MSEPDWVLAVDFGTSNTVAALADEGRAPRVLQVENAPTMPSAVFLSEDGTSWLVGQAAEGSALTDASRYEPNPKRRLGTGTVFLGGREFDVVEVIAVVLGRVFGEAARQKGGTAPAVLVLTHPAQWHGQRLERLVSAARRASPAGWPEPTFMTEPAAAARHMATGSLPPVCRIAVVDLGGGTCDVAVVDRDHDAFTVAGAPMGIDPLGGEDFDARLVAEVLSDLGNEELTRRLSAPETPADRASAITLRRNVRDAKHLLSQSPRAGVWVPPVPGPLPDGASVQVSRARFEELIAGGDQTSGVRDAAECAREAIAAAPAGQPVNGLFLVGGSSRIPMLGRLVAEATGKMPTEYGDPATAVAEGAASHALDQLRDPARKDSPPPPPPPLPPPPPPRPTPPPGAKRKTWLIPVGVIVGVIALVCVVALIAVLANGGGTPSGGGPTGGPDPKYTCADGTVVDTSSECPTSAPPPAAYKCWDGTAVDSLSSCSLPTGTAGLVWVFPTIDADTTTCSAIDAADVAAGAIEGYTCTLDGAKGSANFYRWSSRTTAAGYYDETGVQSTAWTGTSGASLGDVWILKDDSAPTPRQRFYVYSDAPFSAEFYMETDADVDAWMKVFSVRLPDAIYGTKA
jgi:hypothetical protein